MTHRRRAASDGVAQGDAQALEKDRVAIEKARVDLETKRLALEREKLPWWRKSVPATVVTSFIAAMVPVTTGVVTALQNSREAKAQSQRQQHEQDLERMRLEHQIQLDYLDRTNVDAQRLRTLRFVAATSDNPKMLSWASDETGRVEKDLADLEAEIDKQKLLVDAATKSAESAAADAKAGRGEIARLRAEAAQQQRRLDTLRAKRDPTDYVPVITAIDRWDMIGESGVLQKRAHPANTDGQPDQSWTFDPSRGGAVTVRPDHQ